MQDRTPGGVAAKQPAPDRHSAGFRAAPGGGASEPVLSIRDLHVHFVTSHGTVRAVEGVGYDVHAGEMVAIVGESGSGKSVSALAVMRLLPPNTARIKSGSIKFNGREVLTLSDDDMRQIRGRSVSMIFQEPMTSLNPVLTIGLQIKEPLLIHLGMSEEQATARAIDLLTLVGITDPTSRLQQFPHQLSGGMRQRVMIAIGLACNPRLLIADEPTTALDVTIQAQILELMKDLSRRLGIAVIIITHNLGIVARYADRVNVMYAARIVESGPAEVVFGRPLHPYARGLLAAVPRLDRGRSMRLARPAAMCRRWPRSSPITWPRAIARQRSSRSTGQRAQPTSRGTRGRCRMLRRSSSTRVTSPSISLSEADCSAGRASSSAPSTTCRSASARARRWVSSANRAAASRHSAGLSCVSTIRRAERSCSAGSISPGSTRAA